MKEKNILRLEGIYKNGYGTVPKAVMLDQDLTLESKAIYAYLCSIAGSGDQAFPYRETILRQTGISKNAYYRHYNLLIKEGYISVQRPPDKADANIYTLISNPKKLSGLPKKGKPGEHGMLRYNGIKSYGYGMLPRSVMTDERLTIKAKGLYAYFCSFCGGGDSAFPKRDDILFHLDISEPTYYKCYKQLIGIGYLTAIQRRTHSNSKFGVNDYYLNEFIKTEDDAPEKNRPTKKDSKKPGPKIRDMRPDSPGLKIRDIKSDSPGPKIRDIKLESSCPSFEDASLRDVINRYTLSNNSNINNNLTNISQSVTRVNAKGWMDGQRILERLCLEFPIDLKWVSDTPEESRDALLLKFRDHISEKIKNKRIRNLSGYLKASLLNWLRDTHIRESLTAPGSPPGGPRAASYDMKMLEMMVERGIF